MQPPAFKEEGLEKKEIEMTLNEKWSHRFLVSQEPERRLIEDKTI